MSALDRVGVALLTACGLLAGLLSVTLVPLYAGGSIFPVAVLLAAVANVALPLLARGFLPTTTAAALPFLGWLAVVLAFAIVTRPEGDVLLPGGSLQWVTYGMLLAGAVAGAGTLVLTMPVPARPPAARPPQGDTGSRR